MNRHDKGYPQIVANATKKNVPKEINAEIANCTENRNCL